MMMSAWWHPAADRYRRYDLAVGEARKITNAGRARFDDIATKLKDLDDAMRSPRRAPKDKAS